MGKVIHRVRESARRRWEDRRGRSTSAAVAPFPPISRPLQQGASQRPRRSRKPPSGVPAPALRSAGCRGRTRSRTRCRERRTTSESRRGGTMPRRSGREVTSRIPSKIPLPARFVALSAAGRPQYKQERRRDGYCLSEEPGTDTDRSDHDSSHRWTDHAGHVLTGAHQTDGVGEASRGTSAGTSDCCVGIRSACSDPFRKRQSADARVG